MGGKHHHKLQETYPKHLFKVGNPVSCIRDKNRQKKKVTTRLSHGGGKSGKMAQNPGFLGIEGDFREIFSRKLWELKLKSCDFPEEGGGFREHYYYYNCDQCSPEELGKSGKLPSIPGTLIPEILGK